MIANLNVASSNQFFPKKITDEQAEIFQLEDRFTFTYSAHETRMTEDRTDTATLVRRSRSHASYVMHD